MNEIQSSASRQVSRRFPDVPKPWLSMRNQRRSLHDPGSVESETPNRDDRLAHEAPPLAAQLTARDLQTLLDGLEFFTTLNLRVAVSVTSLRCDIH
jgi:hypothetical protein